MRRLCGVLNIDSLKLVCSDFNLIFKYGVIFWSNQQNVNKAFILQKGILRIMLELGYRSSCGSWFKQLEMLTFPCLLMFVIPLTSKLIFLYILSIQSKKNHLRKPLVKFTLIERGIT